MNFLTPTELRRTLKISRSTEHRLLKNGMPSIGGGRLRRYEQEEAVAWFRIHANETTTPKPMLEPGAYRCGQCGFEATLREPRAPTQLGACPRCGSRETPVRVNT
jgi:hypothetical protein